MQIPEQVKGKKSDNQASCEAVDRDAAVTIFKTAVDRLLHVNAWKNFSGFESASFQLCEDSGEPVEQTAREQNFIRIDIPGPGSRTGDGYDWVKIISIRETSSGESVEFQMTVEPSENPRKAGAHTAHFFASGATSTFVVKRDDKKITASVHGRNEEPNKNTESLLDNVRNKLVAGGAFGGFADIQWSNLVEGLLHDASRAR